VCNTYDSVSIHLCKNNVQCQAPTGNKIVCMWCAICREVDISFLCITFKPLYVELFFYSILMGQHPFISELFYRNFKLAKYRVKVPIIPLRLYIVYDFQYNFRKETVLCLEFGKFNNIFILNPII